MFMVLYLKPGFLKLSSCLVSQGPQVTPDGQEGHQSSTAVCEGRKALYKCSPFTIYLVFSVELGKTKLGSVLKRCCMCRLRDETKYCKYLSSTPQMPSMDQLSVGILFIIAVL